MSWSWDGLRLSFRLFVVHPQRREGQVQTHLQQASAATQFIYDLVETKPTVAEPFQFCIDVYFRAR
jgi:hypothetical protein